MKSSVSDIGDIKTNIEAHLYSYVCGKCREELVKVITPPFTVVPNPSDC
jgi:hypothetical protein